MSPASSGALEVERYIGACLISQTRPKGAKQPHGRDFYRDHHYLPRYANNHLRCRAVDGWAGGMPLISFANYQRRKAPQDSRDPLSRLAVHTQGAPLILTSRYNQRKNKTKSFTRQDGAKTKESLSADTVSVNSDESSASTNSENSLPRIIKPRKRRKKDRKPPHLTRPLGAEDTFSTDSASPDIDSPSGIITINQYLPFSFDHYSYSHLNSNVPIKNDPQEAPQLLHAFEDVQLSKDINDNQASSCQCRYCDPSGQIWDVDRNCYSPYLTTPEGQNSFTFPDIQGRSYDAPSELIKCMSDLSLGTERTRSDSSLSGSPRDLEVSTEIVTSLNGHRDLEIRFFSSPDSSKRGAARSQSLDESKRSDNEV